MKKKVCILTSIPFSFDTRTFHKEAKSLAQAGYNVVLICPYNKNETVDSVKIISLSQPPNRFYRMLFTTSQVLRLALKERANVYHFHDPELLPIGMLLKLFTGKKIIYDVYENVKKQILSKLWLPSFSRKAISIFYQIVEWISLFFIDEIIIAEDSYWENYKRRNNVVAIRNYPLLSYGLIQKQNKKNKIFRLIYVGGITKLRGVMEMIETIFLLRAQGYQNIELNLVGPVFPESLRQEIFQLINANGLTNYVHLLGQVPHERIYQFIAKSDVGFAILHPDPNYIGSLATKLFEYMIGGIPVICSNFPLWKQLVEMNDCGISVDPLNPKEIAEAVKYLIQHPEKAKKMGKNGRKTVLEKYNWENESKRLLEIYKKICKK